MTDAEALKLRVMPMPPASPPPYAVRDVRLAPGETRFVDGWLLVRSRRHLFIASPPPQLRLWAQTNTCRRVSIDPKLLWEGRGFLDAAVAQPPRELGHWRVDGLPDACPGPIADELKYKLDGPRHILRQTEYPALAGRLEPLGAFGFALLEMCGREPGFADLIEQNPALAIALAWLRPPGGGGVSQLRSWKQRDLAEHLGFHPSAARLLKRVAPSAITLERLDLLRRLSLDDRTSIDGLRHAQAINALSFALLADPQVRTNVAARLFQEVGELSVERAEAFSWILVSVLKKLREAGGPFPTLRSFTDPGQLFSIAFPMAVHASSRPRSAEGTTRRLSPPFPGRSGIEPLDTVAAILDEGRRERNCIDLDYVRRACRGEAFLYRVTHPTRCTLLLKRDRRRSAGWAIGEFKGFANSSPEPETVSVVQQWFSEVAGSPPPKRTPAASAIEPLRRVWEVASR